MKNCNKKSESEQFRHKIDIETVNRSFDASIQKRVEMMTRIGESTCACRAYLAGSIYATKKRIATKWQVLPAMTNMCQIA